jgi:hypothetical protein
MTEDQKYEIAVLAEDAVNKRLAFESHQLANMATDPQKQIQQGIAYRIAQTEWLEAEAMLRRAQESILGVN